MSKLDDLVNQYKKKIIKREHNTENTKQKE